MNQKLNKLKSGRGLDGLVAREVMGIDTWCTCNEYIVVQNTKCIGCRLPFLSFYSVSIKAAWEVVEKLTEHPGYYDITLIGYPDRYKCVFVEQKDFAAWGYTAPHAICLAALKAVGYKSEWFHEDILSN